MLNNSARPPWTSAVCSSPPTTSRSLSRPARRSRRARFRLVVRNRAAFDAAYGAGLPVAGQWTGHLATDGDTVRLTRTMPESRTEDPRRSALRRRRALARGGQWPGRLAPVDRRPAGQRPRRQLGRGGLPRPTQSRQVLAMTNLWRYEQSGTDLGTAWREPAYNDAAWPAGRALLYVEGAALPAPANTPLALGPMTFYFRTTFFYDGPTTGLRLKVNTVLDDSAVIYVNGKELLRRLASPTRPRFSSTPPPNERLATPSWKARSSSSGTPCATGPTSSRSRFTRSALAAATSCGEWTSRSRHGRARHPGPHQLARPGPCRLSRPFTSMKCRP